MASARRNVCPTPTFRPSSSFLLHLYHYLSKGRKKKKKFLQKVPLHVWNKKDLNRDEDWKEGGDECDEYEIPNKEDEAGRVSLPGSRTRIIQRGMLIAFHSKDPNHAFYVGRVVNIRQMEHLRSFLRWRRFPRKIHPPVYGRMSMGTSMNGIIASF